MTNDEKNQLSDIHRWLFVPPQTGGDSRAKKLDDLMAGVQAGKLTARMVLWLAGIMAAFAAIRGNIGDWLSPPK